MTFAAEDRRQAVHVAMTGFAFALRWLTCDQALACAGAAIALNWVVFPLTGIDRRWLRRAGDPWVDGVKLYPVAVFALIALLPLPQAAAAWVVLGVGDAASNVVGRRFGRPPFLGRPDRSLVGSLAFVGAAAPAALLAHSFVGYAAPDGRSVGVVLAAAVAGALAEYLPLPKWLDDNVPIAAAAGITLWALA